MRKAVLLGGATAVLVIGSMSVGVAAAMTGAPVFYDARSPQPTAPSDEFAIGSVSPTADPGGLTDGAGDDSVAPGTDTAPPSSTPQPPPTRAPEPGPEATPAPTPPADPMPNESERAAWLGFQQLVRECMAAEGHEYREWEWWTTEPRNPNSTAPAMPDGLTPAEAEAWHAALEGPGRDGSGCLGQAVEQDREESATPPPDALVPPSPPPSPSPSPSPAPEGLDPEPSSPDAG